MKKNILLLIIILTGNQTFSQSSNVTLVSQWLNGNYFNAIYVNANYAFCGSDNILNIIDVTDPAFPNGLSQVSLAAEIKWVYADNSKAYVALGDSGLCIVDISNPNIPLKLGSCSITGKALSVKVSGNYAYVASDTAGMKIIDISNPINPIVISSFNPGTGQAKVVDLYGNYACIAYGNSLQLVDVSNPFNPVSAGSLLFSISNVVVSGNYAYTLSSSDFRIINISNPLVPVQIGASTCCSFGAGMAVSGNFAFLSAGNYSYEVWDVNNPSMPIWTASYISNQLTNNTTQQIQASGTKMYCISNSLSNFKSIDIVDVFIPASPVLIGKYIQPGMRTGLCTSGQFLYSGGWTPPVSEMVSIFDLTDPFHPHETGIYFDTATYPNGTGYNMSVWGNYLYLSNTGIASGNVFGIKIIDISNPAAPFKAGTFSISGSEPIGIEVSNNLAYVCYGSLGLVVVDMGNPSSPVQLGSVLLNGGFQAFYIDLSGNYAYVTDNATNMHVIDITNPNSPVEAGTYLLPSMASDIYVEGNYAYVALGEDGFQIIDISVPSNPVLTSSYTTVCSDPRLEIYKYGNFVYLADFLNGLQVIDVSNPNSPIQAGYYYDASIFARNIFADSLHSYLATDGGVYVFNGGALNTTGPVMEQHMQVSVFPNPVKSAFKITIQNSSEKNISLSVKNVLGQILYHAEEKINNQPFNKIIDISWLPAGIYFLDVTGEGSRNVSKIIKE
jgi:hypothetical protein